MQITEEQRRRAEANRLSALAKKQAKGNNIQVSAQNAWNLFRCQKILNVQPQLIVTLEICSPFAFSLSTESCPDSTPEGRDECFYRLKTLLSPVKQAEEQSEVAEGSAHSYLLKDYDLVLKILKQFQDIRLQQVPSTTVSVLRQLAGSSYISDTEVDKVLEKLPAKLRNELLPFQLDGVKFGVRRGGRCLIADEMGVGKTVQAIAIASCYMEEGPMLVVCPASMRFTWAEELERWLPFLPPREIQLVFGRRDNPSELAKCPKIVVISYTMLSRLRKSLTTLRWGFMIVDESQNLRCTKKAIECDETQAVLDIARKVKRIVLLSGTPSLSRPYDIFHQIHTIRPGLLGKDKYEFARNYCAMQLVQLQGRTYKDFSKGIRLQELNILLKETVMIRRMKEDVLSQLPPKRRQVIRLMLTTQDISFAKTTVSQGERRLKDSVCECGFSSKGACDCEEEDLSSDDTSSEIGKLDNTEGDVKLQVPVRRLSYQETGIAKLRSFEEWFSNQDVCANWENGNVDRGSVSQKMVIFAHHLRVLDGIQGIVCQKELEFVRIDGSTASRDRQAAIQTFRSRKEIKIAIVGITAGGVGLDFSAAQSVAFVELPMTTSEMIQAEDRVHRRGQQNAINIYIFCAKDTLDESHWRQLNKSFERISTMMDGKDAGIKNIEVDSVCNLELLDKNAEVLVTKPEDELYHKSGANVIKEPSEGDVCAEHADNPHISIENSPTRGIDEISNGLIECSHLLSNFHDKNAGGDHNILPAEFGKYCLPKKKPALDVKYQESMESNDLAVNNNVKEKQNCPSVPGEQQSITIRQGEEENPISPSLSQTSCMKGFISSEMSCSWHQYDILDCRTSSESKQSSNDLMTNSENCLNCDSPMNSLLFEVSANTGRIHLYTYDFGEEFRPKKLEENFQPEELESPSISDSFLGNPSVRKAVQMFVEEWNELRPVDRNKLFGRPLRLPLRLELSAIKHKGCYTSQGTLKGGSKRRVAPKDEAIDPLPEHASWREIILLNNYKSKERREMQAWSGEGEPLCKLCMMPCLGVRAKCPEYFEDLFCKASCFEEYRMRTSQKYLREVLFSMERGVCTQCNLDCHKLVISIRPLPLEKRRQKILKAAPNFAEHERLLERLVREPKEGNAWHADHIVPVYKGGGECKVENMRTLCVICHAKVTAVQQEDRKQLRAKAKDSLQLTIEKFIERVCQKRMKLSTQISPIKEDEDKDLLIDISGSAYSEKPNNLENLPTSKLDFT